MKIGGCQATTISEMNVIHAWKVFSLLAELKDQTQMITNSARALCFGGLLNWCLRLTLRCTPAHSHLNDQISGLISTGLYKYDQEIYDVLMDSFD